MHLHVLPPFLQKGNNFHDFLSAFLDNVALLKWDLLSGKWRKYVHEVLVNRLEGLSLPRKSVVRLTDRPDMTLDVYRGRKTTNQHNNSGKNLLLEKQNSFL